MFFFLHFAFFEPFCSQTAEARLQGGGVGAFACKVASGRASPGAHALSFSTSMTKPGGGGASDGVPECHRLGCELIASSAVETIDLNADADVGTLGRTCHGPGLRRSRCARVLKKVAKSTRQRCRIIPEGVFLT